MQAREAVEMRAQVERKMAQKEKEKHEEKLREMAQKARERRAGIKTHVEKGNSLSLQSACKKSRRDAFRCFHFCLNPLKLEKKSLRSVIKKIRF